VELVGHLEREKQILMNGEVWGDDFFFWGGRRGIKIGLGRTRTRTDFG
jgi:hypothetical protein